MAIQLVISNSEELAKAITKGLIFSVVTLFLITCALVAAIVIAIHGGDEEFNEVGPFLFLTSPFILQELQLLTTIYLLYSAKKDIQRLSMTKCRLWSVTARILAAPILIEMMILIGFKWYLTVIAIPLVLMYFLTMLQVEKIIHYFFTRSYLARMPNQSSNLFTLDYPYSLRLNNAPYPPLGILVTPRPFAAFAPPSYTDAVAEGRTSAMNTNTNEPPPPPYEEAIKINPDSYSTTVTQDSGKLNP